MLDPSRTSEDTKGLVSIIIPVYNVEKYIRRCLDSIIKQTYRDIEIILVDDGTPDNSGDICEEYALKDDRIKVFHKENGGLSDARNYGIERAAGDYIVCVDSDDYVEEDYIEYLRNLQIKYNTKMAICQHRTLYDNGFVKDIGKIHDEQLSCHDCLKRMLYHDVIDTSAWAKLYKRELFNDISYPKGKIFEDIGTTYALMLQCDYIAVGYEVKYNYVFHNNSIVNGSFSEKKLDMLEMTDQMSDDVQKAFPDLYSAIIRRRVYARFSTLNQMLNTGDKYLGYRQIIISFIKEHSSDVLTNREAPKRDKLAIIALHISYRLYKWLWLRYQNHIMGAQ